MAGNNSPVSAPPMLLRVEAAARELGVSRTRMFELLRSGEVPSLLVGPQTRRVPRAGIEAYVRRKLAEQSPPAGAP